MLKSLFSTAVMIGCLLSPMASASSTDSDNDSDNFALGLGLGTTGASVSGTLGLSDSFNLRGVYANFSFDETQVESGIEYKFDFELDTFSLLLDYHPFADSGFRVSIGAVKNGTELSANSTQTSGTINVGNRSFNSADVGTINAKIDFPSVAPYFGVGWGNALMKNRTISFAFDLGVIAMGDPDVSVSSTGTNASIQSALNTQLEIERQQLEGEIGDTGLYPVVNLSLNVKF